MIPSIHSGDDQTNFHEEVNNDIEIRENAIGILDEDLDRNSEDMVAFMAVLQCLGVNAADASNFAASVVRAKTPVCSAPS